MDGNDLQCEVSISLLEALEGGFERQVRGLDGEMVKICGPAKGSGTTQPGSEIKVKGHGMPISKKPGERGDLIAVIKVTLPSLALEELRVLKSVIA